MFKHADLKIAMHTNNSTQNILVNKKQVTNKTDKYTQSGVYKLISSDCIKVYVGQTGRTFLIKFNEHEAAFRTNSQNSNYAKHLIEHTHTQTHLWPHPRHYADTTTPEQRS